MPCSGRVPAMDPTESQFQRTLHELVAHLVTPNAARAVKASMRFGGMDLPIAAVRFGLVVV